MNRRSFMAGILAACTAPAIVRASSLMKLPSVIVPEWCGVQTLTGQILLMASANKRVWGPVEKLRYSSTEGLTDVQMRKRGLDYANHYLSEPWIHVDGIALPERTAAGVYGAVYFRRAL